MTDDDQARITEVFTTHRDFLESVARRHSPTPEDVPDIVQGVGLRLCRFLKNFRDESQIRTWLFRITVNEARNHYDRHRRFELSRTAAAMPGPEDFADDPNDDIREEERRQALEAGIETLRPVHQHIIRDMLSGSPVLTHRRAARSRARQALRRALADDIRL